MAIELQMLAWAIVLGLVHILSAAMLSTSTRGLAWNAGNREGEAKPLTGVASRLDRASRNFLETFPLFAAAVVCVVLADRDTSQTALGAQIYLWARVAYLPVYAIGVPYLRTLVWAASLWGLLQVLYALF